MKKVLALGGGGPKGVYLEAGALLALDICLDDLTGSYSPSEESPPQKLHPVLSEFSIFQGNSAGVFHAIPLAGGFSPDRLFEAIGSTEGDFAFSYSRYFQPAHMEWVTKLREHGLDVVREFSHNVAQGKHGLWDFTHTASKLLPDGIKTNKYVEDYVGHMLDVLGLPHNYAAFKEATKKELIILATNLRRGTPRKYGWDHDTLDYNIPHAARASSAIPLLDVPVLDEHGEQEVDGAVAKSLSVHGHIARGDFVIYMDPMIPTSDKNPSGLLEIITQVLETMNASRRETALHLQEAKQYRGKCLVLDIGKDHSIDYLRTDRIAESSYHGFMYVLGNAIKHHPDNPHHAAHDAQHATTLKAGKLKYKDLATLRTLYEFFSELHPRQFMHFVMYRGDEPEKPGFSVSRLVENMFRNGHATTNYQHVLDKHPQAVQLYNQLIPRHAH